MTQLLRKKAQMKTNSRFLFLDELPDFAKEYAETLQIGDCVSLSGEMGSGKTTFVFYLLKALGMPEGIPYSSPTFTILNQYELNDLLINHIDLYRLNSFSEWESLDLIREIEKENAITFIEWGNKFSELESFYTKKIHFEYVASKNLERLIQFVDITL